MLSYAVFTALQIYQVTRPKTPFMQDTHALSTICSGCGRIRQTPFSALLPLCGIRHLSPGLQFPKGQGRCSKEQMGGRARALGPSHSLVLCGRGAQLALLRPPVRTLQAAKAHILAKMAAEEPD